MHTAGIPAAILPVPARPLLRVVERADKSLTRLPQNGGRSQRTRARELTPTHIYVKVVVISHRCLCAPERIGCSCGIKRFNERITASFRWPQEDERLRCVEVPQRCLHHPPRSVLHGLAEMHTILAFCTSGAPFPSDPRCLLALCVPRLSVRGAPIRAVIRACECTRAHDAHSIDTPSAWLRNETCRAKSHTHFCRPTSR